MVGCFVQSPCAKDDKSQIYDKRKWKEKAKSCLGSVRQRVSNENMKEMSEREKLTVEEVFYFVVFD